MIEFIFTLPADEQSRLSEIWYRVFDTTFEAITDWESCPQIREQQAAIARQAADAAVTLAHQQAKAGRDITLTHRTGDVATHCNSGATGIIVRGHYWGVIPAGYVQFYNVNENRQYSFPAAEVSVSGVSKETRADNIRQAIRMALRAPSHGS